MTNLREPRIVDRVSSGASYSGGIFAVLSALTLTEWGIVTGILTALGTFFLNSYFQWKRDQREQELNDANIRMIESREAGNGSAAAAE
jgi:hypothetical protein